MYKLEITKAEYLKLKDCLLKFAPNIKIELGECDDALERLGFCISAPCTVYLSITAEELDLLLNRLENLEIEAYNSPRENPTQKDLYLEYGWIWNYLSNVEYVD